jgi:hypothetical protein
MPRQAQTRGAFLAEYVQFASGLETVPRRCDPIMRLLQRKVPNPTPRNANLADVEHVGTERFRAVIGLASAGTGGGGTKNAREMSAWICP